MARTRKTLADTAPTWEAPAAIKLAWFPATFVDTDGELHRRAKVYVTGDDRVVAYYSARPLRTDNEPDFVAALEPGQDKPAAGYAARSGIYLTLANGATVAVTPEGGCGCSHPLKRWSPDFADRVVPW